MITLPTDKKRARKFSKLEPSSPYTVAALGVEIAESAMYATALMGYFLLVCCVNKKMEGSLSVFFNCIGKSLV